MVAGLVANPICNAEVPLLGDFTNAVTYIATTAAGETVEQTMYANWRLCYLIGGIPLVYGIVLFFLMKETPHWYANAGRFDDAVKVLADIERVSLGTETKRDPSCLVVPPRPKKTTPSVLFSNKYIIGTCAIWSLYFVGQFCVYGMNAWLPAWFSGIGYSPSEAVALRPLSCSEASRAWRHSKPSEEPQTGRWSYLCLSSRSFWALSARFSLFATPTANRWINSQMRRLETS